MFIIDNDTNTMTIVKKDTASFDVALENYSLDSGDTVTFTVAKELEQETPDLQIVVADFIDGVAMVAITSEDSNLEVGTYYYDIQVNTRDGRVDTIVGPAKFKVIGGVTY
jgi:hypothetical protein